MKSTTKLVGYISTAVLAAFLANSATGDNRRNNKSYDNNNILVSDYDIDRINNSSFQLDADVAYVSTNGREHAHAQGHGTTFVGAKRNGRQYFITANHVVAPITTLTNPYTGTPLGKINESYTITKDGRTRTLDVLKRDPESDVAILRSQEDLGIDKLCDFVDAPLKEGDFVYVSGFPLDIGRYLVSGTIGQVGEGNNFFLHNAAANPGFSGAAIYVLDRGKPKIAGIARFYRPDIQGVFGAVRPELVQKDLEDVLKSERRYH